MKTRVLLALAVLAGAAISRRFEPRAREELSLPLMRVDGGGPVLRSCPYWRCLSVYLSPDQSEALPFFLALRDFLGERAVTLWLIVGRGEAEAVKSLARRLGPECLVDPMGEIPVGPVLPEFVVSEPHGRVLRRSYGLPDFSDPKTAAILAEKLGLVPPPHIQREIIAARAAR